MVTVTSSTGSITITATSPTIGAEIVGMDPARSEQATDDSDHDRFRGAIPRTITKQAATVGREQR